MSRATLKAEAAVKRGEVFFMGRYRTRADVFKRLIKERQWKKATITEDEWSWIATLGSAVLRVYKVPAHQLPRNVPSVPLRLVVRGNAL